VLVQRWDVIISGAYRVDRDLRQERLTSDNNSWERRPKGWERWPKVRAVTSRSCSASRRRVQRSATRKYKPAKVG
jgi:hypothetical protein